MRLIKILFPLSPLLIISIFCSAQDKVNDDIFPPDLDTVRYVPYRKGKTWFYVDRQHKGPWGYGLAKAWPEEWDMADPFNEYGIALVEKNGRLGFINKNGKLITPLKYSGVNDVFSNGHCLMEDSLGRVELINSKGEIVAPAKKSIRYSYVVKDVFVVFDSSNCQYGLKDIYGTWRIPMGKYFALVMPSKKDTSGVLHYSSYKEHKEDEYWQGYIRFDGEELTPAEFKWTGFISNNLSAFTKNGKKKGYLNTYTGKVQIRQKYTLSKTFIGDVAEVKKKDKNYMQRALIDKTGKELFPEEYEGYASGFNGEYILVKKNNKWGIMNKQGQVTVPFIYDKTDYTDCKFGIFVLTKDKKCGAINGTGEIIIPFEYEPVAGNYPGLRPITPHLICVYKDGKYGIIDRNNNILVPIIYSAISTSIYGPLRNGLIRISDNSRIKHRTIGYLDLSLNQYWEE